MRIDAGTTAPAAAEWAWIVGALKELAEEAESPHHRAWAFKALGDLHYWATREIHGEQEDPEYEPMVPFDERPSPPLKAPEERLLDWLEPDPGDADALALVEVREAQRLHVPFRTGRGGGLRALIEASETAHPRHRSRTFLGLFVGLLAGCLAFRPGRQPRA